MVERALAARPCLLCESALPPPRPRSAPLLLHERLQSSACVQASSLHHLQITPFVDEKTQSRRLQCRCAPSPDPDAASSKQSRAPHSTLAHNAQTSSPPSLFAIDLTPLPASSFVRRSSLHSEVGGVDWCSISSRPAHRVHRVHRSGRMPPSSRPNRKRRRLL